MSSRRRWSSCRLGASSEDAGEQLGSRIRKAKVEKLPYILVVGDDDVASGTVGVNRRGDERPERGVALDEFVARLRSDVDERHVAPGGTAPSAGAA